LVNSDKHIMMKNALPFMPGVFLFTV